jgi:hypothetical protein
MCGTAGSKRLFLASDPLLSYCTCSSPASI